MQRLAAQQMEVLRRRRAVGDADVALGTEREETLEPCTRVLGSLAFVAMGQQQREPRRLAPFRQPSDQELVDDHFGAVGEIAELRFPKHQRVLCLHGVAVLESQARILGEGAVVQLEWALGVGKMLDRRMPLPGLDVMQHEVPLTERATLGVLASQADRRAPPLDQQRREGERFRVGPFDALLRRERVAPALELLQQLGMYREAVWNGE